MKRLVTTLVLVSAFSATSGRTEIKPMALFSDHAVLQEGIPVPVWGTAAPGEKVTVTYAGQSQSSVTGTDGRWMVKLGPLKSGLTDKLTMQGKNTVVANDVITGDVWLCSGQSNMARALGKDKIQADPVNATAIKAANDPQMRLFRIDRKSEMQPQTDVAAHWELCTPQSLILFTAVGYYFARDLRAHFQKSVGLIESAVGGTRAECWMSSSALQKDPAFSAPFARYNEALSAPTPRRLDPAVQRPTSLFNAMIAPLIPYAIKGAIWYQGEADAVHPTEYRKLLPALITDWRTRWNQGDFPFLFVQLARFNGPQKKNWPFLQEAQAQTLSLPHTGMAVANDIGDPTYIHPSDKTDVGHRLALAARHVAYGEDLVYSGPAFDQMKIDGGTVTLTFKQTGGGLIIGSAPWLAPKQVAIPTTSLVGFTLGGAGHGWVPATAKIVDDHTVVLSSPQEPNPTIVRYAWGCFGNLYNKEQLPAVPFRTDKYHPETETN